MLGSRIREIRNTHSMSLQDLAQLVGKSAATLSRYENNHVEKLDLDFIENLADVLNTTSAYLLGMADDYDYSSNIIATKYIKDDKLTNIIVTDDDMSPALPCDAYVQIRPLFENETLEINSFYYIKFNNKKVFRMVIDDQDNGIGFLPMRLSERRIAYDMEYVTVIGKAVSMKVLFEDN